jgi:hypothetical protein
MPPREAFAGVRCWGEGDVCRTVTGLQREFFKPPTFGHAQWEIGQEQRSCRLQRLGVLRQAAGR